MPIERSYVTFYVLAIAMLVMSVTVCEIITFKRLNILDSIIFDLEIEGQERRGFG